MTTMTATEARVSEIVVYHEHRIGWHAARKFEGWNWKEAFIRFLSLMWSGPIGTTPVIAFQFGNGQSLLLMHNDNDLSYRYRGYGDCPRQDECPENDRQWGTFFHIDSKADNLEYILIRFVKNDEVPGFLMKVHGGVLDIRKGKKKSNLFIMRVTSSPLPENDGWPYKATIHYE